MKRKSGWIAAVAICCIAAAGLLLFSAGGGSQAAKSDTNNSASADKITAGDVLNIAESSRGSGKKVAEALNGISSTDEYNTAVRDVLDHYYKNNDSGSYSADIAAFENTADTRSDEIVSSYKIAAAERKSTDRSFKTQEVLLTFGSGTDDETIKSAVEKMRGECLSISTALSGEKIADAKISYEYTVSKAVAQYSSLDDVVSAQPDYKYHTMENRTNDKYYDLQYYLTADEGIDAESAWDQAGKNGTAVKVAVIDTGVKADQEDLNIDVAKCARITNSKVTVGKISDSDGHGTFVSGIIAAVSGNGKGIAGVATGSSNDAVDLIVINAATRDKETGDLTFYTKDLVKSIDYAADNGAKLINMSLGGPGKDDLVENEIASAYKKGSLCICASGNEGTDKRVSPSDAPEAVSVIATDYKKEKTYYSNYGVEKDIAAPGDDIIGTWTGTKSGYSGDNTKYTYESGTSMATPVVTASAALLLYKDPGLTPREVKNLLYSSGSSSFSKQYGFGRLDIGKAMTALTSSKTSPSEIVLNRTSATVHTGDHIGLEYTVLPANTSDSTASFTSSDTSVARVSGDGIVDFYAPGTASVTATAGGASASCTFKVLSRYKNVSLKGGTYADSGSITSSSALSTYKKHDDISSYMTGYEISAAKNDRITVFEKSADFTVCAKIVNSSGKCVAEKIGSDDLNSSGSVSYTAGYTGKYYVEVSGDPTMDYTSGGFICATGSYGMRITALGRASITGVSSSAHYSTVKWKKVANAGGYYIYRSASKNGTYKRAGSVSSGSVLHAKITKPVAGKNYYYKVRAYKKAGGRYYYGTYSAAGK
ncbi:MAG: S8 family serine peptidase [Eubacteriaceae bacterium]|jgi:subtilisin family serine protease|nr:S8 family serine peptidase [Eubacteriaceae bacterium]